MIVPAFFTAEDFLTMKSRDHQEQFEAYLARECNRLLIERSQAIQYIYDGMSPGAVFTRGKLENATHEARIFNVQLIERKRESAEDVLRDLTKFGDCGITRLRVLIERAECVLKAECD